MALDEKTPLQGTALKYDPAWVGIKTHRGCKDILFAIIFLLFAAGLIGIAIYGFAKGDPSRLEKYNSEKNAGDTAKNWVSDAAYTIKRDHWTIFGLCLAAVAVGFTWLLLMKTFPKIVIYTTLLLGVVALFAVGAVLVAIGSKRKETAVKVIGFIVWAVCAVLLIVLFFLRKRIAFTALMLQEGCKALANNLTLLFAVTPLLMSLYLGFVVVWLLTLINLYSIPKSKLESDTRFEHGPRVLLVFLLFGSYWVTTLHSAIVQTTASGTVSLWYFGRSGVAVTGNASLTALKNSLTHNFGSLCFGSLVLAAVKFITFMLKVAEKRTHNPVMKFLFCCMRCFCICIREALEYLSTYAYIYIAVHGYSFLEAARETSHLFSRSGLERVVTDVITRWVLFMGTVFCTAVMIIIAVLVADHKGGVNGWSILVVALVTAAVFYLISLLVRVAVDTVFVCYLEDVERNQHSRNFIATSELHEAIQDRARALGCAPSYV